jgi:hypothetical protein
VQSHSNEKANEKSIKNYLLNSSVELKDLIATNSTKYDFVNFSFS